MYKFLKDIYKNVYYSIIYNSFKLDIVYMFIKSRIDEWIVVYFFNGMLYRRENIKNY